jgi:tRNA 2-thiouridine synthesizing protein E
MARAQHHAGSDNQNWEVTNDLEALGPWNETLAEERAYAVGISMTNDHWNVVHYLRAQYAAHGLGVNSCKLVRDLQKRFKDKGGKKYLFELFPGGPIRQGSMIAGVPKPADCDDLSFGSVH